MISIHRCIHRAQPDGPTAIIYGPSTVGADGRSTQPYHCPMCGLSGHASVAADEDPHAEHPDFAAIREKHASTQREALAGMDHATARATLARPSVFTDDEERAIHQLADALGENRMVMLAQAEAAVQGDETDRVSRAMDRYASGKVGVHELVGEFGRGMAIAAVVKRDMARRGQKR